FQSSHCA
ncbi:hypothetical protein VCHC37A1_0507B, partial [Vibrio cholerae HC-37A1]